MIAANPRSEIGNPKSAAVNPQSAIRNPPIRAWQTPQSEMVLAWLLPALVLYGCDRNPSPRRTLSPSTATRGTLSSRRRMQREKGLGGRVALPPDGGMLFIFADAKLRSFWMLDCKMVIDIAFISAERRVVRIYTMYPQPGAPPEALPLYDSEQPAQFAIEVSEKECVGGGRDGGTESGFLTLCRGSDQESGCSSSTLGRSIKRRGELSERGKKQQTAEHSIVDLKFAKVRAPPKESLFLHNRRHRLQSTVYRPPMVWPRTLLT